MHFPFRKVKVWFQVDCRSKAVGSLCTVPQNTFENSYLCFLAPFHSLDVFSTLNHASVTQRGLQNVASRNLTPFSWKSRF